jgi:choline dehydrogenase
MTHYDYIIVGAGTAGCVIASRLSEDPKVRVLLIEAGRRDTHWSIRIPSAIGRNYKSGPYNWGFWSTPQKHLNDRVIVQARGRVLGGSSSVNGMVYLRAHALDFERWVEEEANTGATAARSRCARVCPAIPSTRPSCARANRPDTA